jgi:hypothetical protein
LRFRAYDPGGGQRVDAEREYGLIDRGAISSCTSPTHALVGMLTPGADPVRKVSIVPRDMAFGVTLSAPDRIVLEQTRA